MFTTAALSYLESERFYNECREEGLLTPIEHRKRLRAAKKQFLGAMHLTPEEIPLPKSEVCRQRCTELNLYRKRLTREAALEEIKTTAKTAEQRAHQKRADREELLKRHYAEGRLTRAEFQEKTIAVLTRCNKTIDLIREEAELRQKLAEYKWTNAEIDALGDKKTRDLAYLRAISAVEKPYPQEPCLRGILKKSILLGGEHKVRFEC